MTHKRLPVKLLPATVRQLRPGMLPRLPEWYPLDRAAKGDGPTPPPYSDAERRELRQRQAVTEACRGPYDGQRGLVVDFDTETGPPREYRPVGVPTVCYVYSARESSAHELIYRYDPTCAAHAGFVRAVEDAYREVRQDYTIAAREETDHERSAPSKL